MSNVFGLGYEVSTDEDYFTNCLKYVIDKIPQIGQEIVDTLFQCSDLPSPQFLECEKHPKLSKTSRPDFLIKCKNLNIICEHKLESCLGKQQLERYLDLAIQQKEETYLAFISKSLHDIPSQVLNSPKYLKPASLPHYMWQDFYPIISSRPEFIAEDFTSFMESFGMQPFQSITGWEGLFSESHPEVVEVFRQNWEMARSHFRSLGARCMLDGPDRYGFRISYPVEWLHLLYLRASENHGNPLLQAWIWIPDNMPCLNAFKGIERKFQSEGGLKIAMQGKEPGNAGWKLSNGTKPKSVATYSTPLAQVLSTDSVATQAALLDFAIAVFDHAREIVEVSEALSNLVTIHAEKC